MAGETALLRAATALFLAFGAWQSVTASPPPPAYERIAHEHGVPADILWAVARVESNFQLTIGTYPWPWTLNVSGRPMYFRTRDEACSAAVEAIGEYGPKSVDIGLTQQNWGWVGRDFYAHPCDALDPYENLRTAAIRLSECYEKHDDWVMAAGCYHRPAGGAPAQRYRRAVLAKLEELSANAK